MKTNYLFVDGNTELVEKVRAAGFKAIRNDYFDQATRIPNPVLMTASNPHWTFGGGIDRQFWNEYYDLCADKQMQGGGNERIGNICFVVTVNDRLRATYDLVHDAIKFALDNTAEHETLLIHGAGTGIGGFAHDQLIEILKALLTPTNNQHD